MLTFSTNNCTAKREKKRVSNEIGVICEDFTNAELHRRHHRHDVMCFLFLHRKKKESHWNSPLQSFRASIVDGECHSFSLVFFFRRLTPPAVQQPTHRHLTQLAGGKYSARINTEKTQCVWERVEWREKEFYDFEFECSIMSKSGWACGLCQHDRSLEEASRKP